MYIIMDDNFRRLGEITEYKSQLWHPLYLDVTGGDFQFELPADLYIDYIEKDFFIYNTEDKKVGIIDTFDIVNTEEDGRIMTVSGKMAESILQRRIIFPTMSVSGKLDDVVAAIIRKHVTNCSNKSRRITSFSYVSNADFSNRVSKQFTGSTVADAIRGLCSMFGYGYTVTLNDTLDGFEMQLVEGLDRSLEQTKNPWVAFTTSDYGVTEFTYKTSNAGLFTHVICAGEGEGLDRKSVTYPTSSRASTRGIKRREVFLDKKDISSNAGEENELDEDTYLEKLTEEAKGKLAENGTTEACEGVVKLARYTYGVDFNLGDIVSVQDDELGMGYTIRVLGVLLSKDENDAQEVSIEMGNLQITDASDPEEEDEEEEVEEEPVIDPITVSLNDDIRLFTFENGTLIEADATGAEAEATGRPTGWVHIFDNEKVEITLTANTKYYLVGTENPSLGTFKFTLTPEQYAVIGTQLETEMKALSFPVFVIENSAISLGYVTIEHVSSVYSEDEEDAKGAGDYTVTCSTALNIGAPAGAFSLHCSGVRTVKINPPASEILPEWRSRGQLIINETITKNEYTTVPVYTLTSTLPCFAMQKAHLWTCDGSVYEKQIEWDYSHKYMCEEHKHGWMDSDGNYELRANHAPYYELYLVTADGSKTEMVYGVDWDYHPTNHSGIRFLTAYSDLLARAGTETLNVNFELHTQLNYQGDIIADGVTTSYHVRDICGAYGHDFKFDSADTLIRLFDPLTGTYEDLVYGTDWTEYIELNYQGYYINFTSPPAAGKYISADFATIYGPSGNERTT